MQKQIDGAIKTYEHAKRTEKTQSKTKCKDFFRVTQTTTDAPGETKLYNSLFESRLQRYSKHITHLKSDKCNVEEHLMKHCHKYAIERQILTENWKSTT